MDERDRLKGEYLLLRSRARIGARILLVGLGLEIVVLLVFARDKPTCETAFLILAAALVLCGVWVEYSSHNKAEDVAEDLQQIADSEVASAGERASKANRRAKKAALALAKIREPRGLTLDQIGRIAGKLTQFADTKYVVGVSFPDPEFMVLKECIDEALEWAEWEEVDCPFPDFGTKLAGAGVGIVVAESPSEKGSLVSAGLALAEALKVEKIEMKSQVIIEDQPEGTSAIMYIMVGPKI